jgi:hypothetical protein
LTEPAELDDAWADAANDLAEALPEAEPLITDAATSEFGAMSTEIVELSGGANDPLADLAAIGAGGLRGLGSGGGTGGAAAAD